MKLRKKLEIKYLVLIFVVVLMIGFATCVTIMELNGEAVIASGDFELEFNRAVLNGANRTKLVSKDKKSITFTYNDINGEEVSTLEYEVLNKSTQYDADVSVTCSSSINDGSTFTYGDNDAPASSVMRIEAGKMDKGLARLRVFNKDTVTHEAKGTLYDLLKNSSLGGDQSIDYDTVSSSESLNAIYETSNTDSGNPVYFYRGAVDANNVIFAGRCWLMVRTTETKGVKLLYNGVPLNGSCLPLGNTISFGLVDEVVMNEKTDDNAYVGYMYGSSGSDTYEATHENIHDSSLKKYLDSWYEGNLLDTKYAEYLEDTVWCNDRSLLDDYANINAETPTDFSSFGWGLQSTYYAPFGRIGMRSLKTEPTYKCRQENDRFTVSANNGNGDLTYPVGTITADELVFAGATGGVYNKPSNQHTTVQNNYYLNVVGERKFMSMTPYEFRSSDNSATIYNYYHSFMEAKANDESYYAMPMISLKLGVQFLDGDGTKADPYILESEDINNNIYTCTMSYEKISRTTPGKFDMDLLQTGDEYCIGDECFHVISNNNGVLKMLAKYNLYVGKIFNTGTDFYWIPEYDPLYGKQNESAYGYTLDGSLPYVGTTEFSEGSPNYDTSLVKTYVDEYVDYLKLTYKVTNIEGSLISKEELEALGCDAVKKNCRAAGYEWLGDYTYWTRSVDSTDASKVYLVGSDLFFGSSSYTNNSNRGVRPLITMYTHDNQPDAESDEFKNSKLFQMMKLKSRGLDTDIGVNYNQIATNNNGNGVLETTNTDSEEPVYFYRGEVDNNVIFGGFCWNIVRTTETGGVKLIYSGVPNANYECKNTGSSVNIGSSAYSSGEGDNAYIGYMYGTPGSNNYNDTHANINDSAIKKVVDEWYKNNFFNTEYAKMIEDTVYCNERKIETPGVGNSLSSSQYTTLGFGANATAYASVSRTASQSIDASPTYRCSQANDRFTVLDSNGNGKLSYPIGLLTSDEAIYAGATLYRSGAEYSNQSYYLYSGSKFYTMSPTVYNYGNKVVVGAVNADDTKGNGYLGVEVSTIASGVRPVISLKNDVYIEKGKGTKELPYRVKTLDDLPEEEMPVEWRDNGVFSEFYDEAYDKMKTLTLEEKVGQLIIAHHDSSKANDAIKNYHVGGFTYFESDFLGKTEESVKMMISNEQGISKVPLVTAVDEEGGRVVRISSNTGLVTDEMSKYPELFYTNINNKNAWKLSKQLYEEGGFDLIKRETLVKSGVLKRLGLNVNFAPVADMAAEGSYITDRVVGLDASGTGEYAKTVISASKGTGVAYTLKHFPGYGNNSDTHGSPSVDDKTLEELMSNDIVPFKMGIEAGAEFVLVAHNIVACIDANNPASLSKPVHDLLRGDIGYTGLIVTDALDMGATKDLEDKFIRAIQAGNNLILVADYKAAHDEIMSALRRDILSEKDIEKLVFRILAWKYYMGIIS